jgi:hypothetical protein
MSVLSPNQIGHWIDKAGLFAQTRIVPVKYDDAGGHTVIPSEAAKAIAFYDVAIAVCLAESNGNTNAVNGNAKGLWQIMTSVHRDLINEVQRQVILDAREEGNTFGGRVPSIFHPWVNTACAARLYGQSAWKPWEAYNTGAYRKHLGHGKAYFYSSIKTPAEAKHEIEKLYQEHMLAVETGQLAGSLVPGGAVMGNDLFNNPVDAVLAFLKEAGVTVGVFILGLVLLILGVWFLMSQTAIGASVKGAVKKAVPVA